MVRGLHPVALKFWTQGNGKEPVRDFLRELPKSDRVKVGEDIRKLQFGWPLGMPLVRMLDDGLWELRSSLPSRRECRIVFAADENVLVFLHAFIKKSEKTPSADLVLGRQRMKDLRS